MVTGRCDRPEANAIAGLVAAGVEVRVLGDTSGPWTGVLRGSGILCEHVVFSSRMSGVGRRAIRAAIRAFEPDIVHAFTNKALACAIPALRGSAAKLIGYRGTTGHLAAWDPGAWLTYRHRRVSAIVCVSDAVRDYVRTVRRPDQVLTIRKGHDPEWYATHARTDPSEFGVPPGGFVAGCVANIRKVKGVDVLVEALRRIPIAEKVHVVLVGEVRDAGIRAALSDPSLRARLHSTGYRNDATRLMSGFDVAVMPSIEREGLPKAVIEAMSQGVPAIVSRVGGMPELVEDGVCGFVVPPADPSALADALRVLAADPDRCARFGAAARQRIESRYHVRATIAETLALYARLVGGRPAAPDA